MAILLLFMLTSTLHAGLFEEANQQNLASFASLYKPIGKWAGQIFLPQPDRRHSDGSVPFLVFSSPHSQLIGRIVKLSWNRSALDEDWFYSLALDVNFDPETRAFGEKHGCKFPTALDGWKKVSPLESLAANRSEGTIEVLLKNAVYQNSTLYISEEPVQVNGSHVCLARFIGKAQGNLRRIVHYNPASGMFDGPVEIVTIMPRKPANGEDAPSTSLELIEESALNNGGWYLYGKKLTRSFLVKSVEPRMPLLVRPTVNINDKQAIREYAPKKVFEGLRPAMYRVTQCEQKETDKKGTGSQKLWPVGSQHLLIHLFGWRKLEGSKVGVMDIINLVTGHFAFGFATVVQDRFTGEPRWDIEYKQVYGHNRDEVVSGSIKWHAYMGNLRRGWMYSIPVADTIIKIPELQPYKINGREIRPMRGLARELEKMMALYRVGAGTGCSMVRPDVSCVQDSHCALYAGLDRLTGEFARRPETREWLKTGSADALRFKQLLDLARDIENSITRLGIAQGNWRNFVESPFGTRNPNKVAALINTMISLKTMFPRAAHDHLLSMAAQRKYPMWTILTCQIGGVLPGMTPQKPTSLLHK